MAHDIDPLHAAYHVLVLVARHSSRVGAPVVVCNVRRGMVLRPDTPQFDLMSNSLVKDGVQSGAGSRRLARTHSSCLRECVRGDHEPRRRRPL